MGAARVRDFRTSYGIQGASLRMLPAEIELMETRLTQLIQKYPGITPEMEAMFYIAYTRGFSDAWWNNSNKQHKEIH